ncbi:ATP-binding protein [Pseudoalteromonas sp. YIC-656]|uniref:ATP-binding protein n=1 Tax=Pseudoalteromonas pernae TaxID=3118054 RepID=UPI0032427BD0
MMKFRPHTLLALVVLSCLLGFATHAHANLVLKAEHQHSVNASTLNVDDGLSANPIQDIEFDKFARLWVATQDGVNMLDGNQVVAFGPSHEEQGLKGSYIYELLIDHQYGLWVVSNHGIERLDTLSYKVTDFVPTLPEAQEFIDLIQWDDSRVAVLADNQLVLIDTTDLSVANAPDSFEAVHNQVAINGRLLIKQADGFSWVDPHTFALTPAYPVPSERRVISYTVDSDNFLWVVSLGGSVHRCDEQQCEAVSLVNNSGEVASAGRVVFEGGKLFMTSSEGLFVVDSALSDIRLLTTERHKNIFNKRLHYQSLLLSENGDILIGAMEGLYLLPSSYAAISSYPDFDSLFGEEPLSAAAIDVNEMPRLVVAGSNSLLYFEEQRGELTLLEQQDYPEAFEPVHFIETPSRVYLNSYRSGALFYANGQWQPLGALMPELAKETTPLSDVYEFASGDLLLLYLDELVFMRENADKYVVQWRTQLPTALAFGVTVRDNTLFIATFKDGLLIADWQSERAPENWQISVKEKNLTGIEQSDDSLVMLSLGHGLSRVSSTPEGFQVIEIDDNDLLINKVTLCMAPYLDDDWIVSTNNGVAVFDNTLTLKSYLTMDDGLSHRESIQFGCTKINNSTINVGINGLTIFHDKVPSKPRPQLNWVSSKVDGQSFTIYDDEQVFTAPDMLAFKTALSFTSLNDDTLIEYALNSQQGEWTKQEETLVTLPSLSSGTYQLFVRARLNNGTLSNTLKFQFKVKPPMWLQLPAIILYTLLFAAFIVWIYSLIMRNKLDRLSYLEKQQSLQDAYTRELQHQIKQTTEELEHKQRMRIKEQQEKARFITGASHDLRNLVSLLKLNVVKRSPDDSPKARSDAHVGSIVESLDHLTDNIVQLSKLDAGIIEPIKGDVAIVDILQSVDNVFSPLCQSKHLTLKLTATADQRVHTDGHLLLRLVNNLVDNAIKNTPENGEVAISAVLVGDECHLTVKDTGPGLPDEISLDTITPFSRGTHTYTGSGLGLSVVSKIAELLNITLNYRNGHPHGAIFELVLPTVTLTENHCEDDSQLPSPVNAKLAVVEDDPQQLDWLASALGEIGYEVHGFTNADELIACSDDDFAAIISDVDLAQAKDGIEHMGDYRQKLRNSGVIVYVSGNENAKIRLTKGCGAYFMKKPIKLKKLEQLLIRGLKQ